MKLFKRRLDIYDQIFLGLLIPLLPIFILDLIVPTSSTIHNFFDTYYLILWIALILEFFLRLSRAKSKREYIVHNWVEIVIIFFPFLRLFRLIRLLELGFLVVAEYVSKKLLSKNHFVSFINLILLVVIIVFASTELILFFEKGYSNSPIKNFNDALWWSTVGVSTIGVGNIVPVSPLGKIATIFLMVTGMITFGIIIANFAAILAEKGVQKDITSELKTLEHDLKTMEEEIHEDVDTDKEEIEQKLKLLEKKINHPQ